MCCRGAGEQRKSGPDAAGRSPKHGAPFSLQQGNHAQGGRPSFPHRGKDGWLDLTFCLTLSFLSCLSDGLIRSQGHETCALLLLEKIGDRNLINCTNAALQT